MSEAAPPVLLCDHGEPGPHVREWTEPNGDQCWERCGGPWDPNKKRSPDAPGLRSIALSATPRQLAGCCGIGEWFWDIPLSTPEVRSLLLGIAEATEC